MKKELEQILNLHKMWVEGNEGGVRANLYRADLRGADLSYDDLSCANLSSADLRGADLSSADLSSADLSSANLRGADLSCAVNCYIFNAYDTSKRIVYCVRHKENWMVKAGCFWGNLDELENKVLNTHRSKVCLANIAILKELSKR